MTATTESTERELERRALTLAVVCVEQRVEALRTEWRAMSDDEQFAQPGLEQQIVDERGALTWLTRRREEAYRA